MAVVVMVAVVCRCPLTVPLFFLGGHVFAVVIVVAVVAMIAVGGDRGGKIHFKSKEFWTGLLFVFGHSTSKQQRTLNNNSNFRFPILCCARWSAAWYG